MLLLQHPYCFDSSFVLSVLLTRQLEFAFSHPLLVVGLDSAASCFSADGRDSHALCGAAYWPVQAPATCVLRCQYSDLQFMQIWGASALGTASLSGVCLIHLPTIGFAPPMRRVGGLLPPSALWNFCGASVMGEQLVPQCMQRVCGMGGQSHTLCTAAFAFGQHIQLVDAAFAPDQGCRGC